MKPSSKGGISSVRYGSVIVLNQPHADAGHRAHKSGSPGGSATVNVCALAAAERQRGKGTRKRYAVVVSFKRGFQPRILSRQARQESLIR